MNGLTILVCLAVIQLPSVEVTTLRGDQQRGVLETFTADSIVVKTDAGPVSIPIGELLSIQSTQAPAATPADPAIELRLVDDSRLKVLAYKSANNIATISHPVLGELKLPASNVSSVRFAPPDPKVDGDWAQLIDRATKPERGGKSDRSVKKDIVAVRKGDVLDHLDGVIGSVTDATVQLQYEGDDIPIKREKAFGLIFSKRESQAKKVVAIFELVSGDRLAVRQIGWNGTVWKLNLVSGLELQIASDLFRTLDYSFGKVTYLSDPSVEPRAVKYTPYFNIHTSFPVNEYRRDLDFDGNRISLFENPRERKIYSKGLAIHSRNLLQYRLGGEYRRFQATMGIGAEVPKGEVDVTFKGDNKILFKGTVKAIEADDKGDEHRAAAQKLDIDVAGVVELEILVDYGGDKTDANGRLIKANDIGDRLYLANARLIK